MIKKNKAKERMPRRTLVQNIIITTTLLMIFTLLAMLFFYLGKNTTSVAIIYILAVMLIARYTSGYAPGIIASFIGVICVNYVFTFPFMQINFTMDGYPVTFLGMIIISSVTSTLTSHLKQKNQIIQEREKLLIEAEKETMRANLLRAISHDLRTPLTGIIGTCSTFFDTKNSLTREDENRLIQNIYSDANWLLNMVENLLTITRISTTKAPIHTTPELLEEVISEAVQRFRSRLPDADVHVKVPEDYIMIPVDAILIEQVLINLMENAYYHGNPDKPIELTLTTDASFACIHVRDFGPGIPEEKLTTIFEGSPSTPNQSGDSRKGMGIGLTICRTIITAHGGEIYASNHENGAEFICCLPLKEEPNESEINDYHY